MFYDARNGFKRAGGRDCSLLRALKIRFPVGCTCTCICGYSSINVKNWCKVCVKWRLKHNSVDAYSGVFGYIWAR